MGLFGIIEFVHIVAGAVCLFLGFFASWMKKRKGAHTVIGELYHGAYVVIFLTSIFMAIWNWSESSYLFYIALFSYGLALYGYLARKRRWKNWMIKHISGMLGSYIGVITAFLVVNQSKISVVHDIPSLIVWFLPTIIGSPIIAMVSRKYQMKRKDVGLKA